MEPNLRRTVPQRNDGTAWKVGVFTLAMGLVAAMLVLVFGDFRFQAGHSYRAIFTDAARLKSGQDVRMAGLAVGTVRSVELNDDKRHGRLRRQRPLPALHLHQGAHPIRESGG